MVETYRLIRSGGRTYYSSFARSLVETTGIPDPVAATEYLAGQLLSDVGVDEPPVPLDVLASFQGITSVEIVDMPGSGMLLPMPDGELVVRLRAGDSPGRRNFSLAHEIGHTLMPGYRENPEEKADLQIGGFDESDEEEFFCDIAGRSLLLPEKLFRARCAQLEPSIDNLLFLAEQFACSLEATALRLDQLGPWPCVAIVWEMQLKPAQTKAACEMVLPGLEEMSTPLEEYRVKYHAGRGTDLFFPAFKHIDRDSCMVVACLHDGCYVGDCVLPAAKKDAMCYVEAVAVPYRDEHLVQRSRIISLVYHPGGTARNEGNSGGLPVG